MPLLGWIILFCIMGSVCSVSGAGLILLFPETIRKKIIPALISYATGVLLTAAFIGLLPHAIENSEPDKILFTVLIGIIIFFILEKLILWRHCHNETCEVHTTAGPLILFGDSFHNFVDGVLISASFLTSFKLGIITSLAVIAHEVPQEVGDFGILLYSGYSRLKAFIYNQISSLTTLLGALIAFYFLESTKKVLPYVLAISAASFIYIALADLTPNLHKKITIKHSIEQFILLIAGIITILFLHNILHHHH